MFYLISQIQYEGDTLHGVFSTKEKAKKAREYLKNLDYDTTKWIIKYIQMDVVFAPYCEDLFPSTMIL